MLTYADACGGALELPIARFSNVAFAYPEGKELFKEVDLCVDGQASHADLC
jgi:hypothetical protein